MVKKRNDETNLLKTPLTKHFGEIELTQLLSAYRLFPVTARVDLQHALEQMLADKYESKLFGAHREYSFDAMTFASFLDTQRSPVLIGPLQYDEVNIGEIAPARCLKSGVWLCKHKLMPFALLLSVGDRRSEAGVNFGIAVPPGEAGLEFSRQFLDELQNAVYKSGSYRGKVISLEAGSRYSGEAGAVRVHKLREVKKEDVILPSKTLQLLERNVTDFIKHRPQLQELGMAVKKGLLFYGPPGTGKTHTIHYLANQLPEHTTLLITANQVGLLDEYFLLARFLQPALVVIEDADLIARDRELMDGPCEESLLNKLLNEMDGLREDAEILFVLTTNRPEQLEAALASRPGRVDQAIEFPMPDGEGRRKLVKLYAKGLSLTEELVDLLVKRTEGASPAFIKELMRRSAQHLIQKHDHDALDIEDIKLALEDMLFSGGSLNARLLGGAVTAAQQ